MYSKYTSANPLVLYIENIVRWWIRKRLDFSSSHGSTSQSFETLAGIQRDEDWRDLLLFRDVDDPSSSSSVPSPLLSSF